LSTTPSCSWRLEVVCGLLDVDEAGVLAKLGVDDLLLHHGLDILEALLQSLIGFEEAMLEEGALIRELLLGCGLGGDEFLDLRQQ
jgi:hypothetical protein